MPFPTVGPSWLDPAHVLSTNGYLVLVPIAAIIFAECGILLGFFLPGDTLLFTAGLFASRGLVGTPLWLLCVVLVVSAVAGNALGYEIGARVGPRLFSKQDSRLFKQQHVSRTREFFDKYGARAIVLARFVPVVRTFITAMAGVGRMDRRRFLGFSLLGGTLWVLVVTLAGFYLGKIEFVRANLEPVVVGIALISAVPLVVEYLKTRRRRSGEEDVEPA